MKAGRSGARAPVSIALTHRRLAQIALDLSLAFVAWGVAYAVRFNFDLGPIRTYLKPPSIVVFALLQVAALFAVGTYSRLWRYTSLPDLRLLVAGVGLGTFLVLALVVAAPAYLWAPRGVLLAQPIFFLVLISAARIAWRLLMESRRQRSKVEFGEPIFVIGAGSTAVALLTEFQRTGRWRAVGLLDDDPAKQRRVLLGVRVLGTLADFARESARLHVHKAVIAIPSMPQKQREELARNLSAHGAEVYTLPPIDSLHPGAVVDASMRRVRPEELLRRDPVILDRAGLKQGVEDKVVLVTGAGGSIGSELCRQIAELQPAALVLLELNEFALYQISEELRDTWRHAQIVTAIGDVKDETRITELMTRYRPSLVFHAAAYKHVPLMEQVNAFEALRNNAWGSMVVARAAAGAGVERLVVVSTDKAVNPTNVMGATKRLAEMLVQEVTAASALRVSIVRFGNVLGSAGSVIPKFVEQIQRGGPVSVTHPDITRYFMSIPEAAQLVVLSSSVGKGGQIFVLDMGEPVRIVDLAEDLIRLMGHSREDIDIVFTGLRPGEKLFEELLFDQETTLQTEHPRIRIARAQPPRFGLADEFVAWMREKPARSDFEVRQLLARLVSEYTPDARVHTALERAA
jgi:FlaA1/EpsC-like NDP-sugar epimerase